MTIPSVTSVPVPPPPVGRLAPSPTGLLHLGHARTFLIAWWHLRVRGGRVLLRFEDLDGQRCRQDFIDSTLSDLEWLGLDWDGSPEIQSTRLQAMKEKVAALLDEGRAYPCVCTRGDLRRALSAPHRGDREMPYPGTCRGRFPSIAAARRAGCEPVVRFTVPAGAVSFHDAVFGRQTFNVASECGDFVIARRDANIGYQLAVVLDDARQGITEVHRGADLLPSTARQLLLQEALRLPRPRWVHLPLVVDGSGRRLAKRSDDLSMRELRNRGVEARDVVGWVASSVGMDAPHGGSAAELTPLFDLDLIHPGDVPAPICPWPSRG